MVEENWISYDVQVTEKWHLKNSEGRAIYWSVDRCSSWPCFDTVAQLLPVDEFQALHECSANRAVDGWKKNKKYHRVHLSVEKTLYKSNCIDSLFTEHSFFFKRNFYIFSTSSQSVPVLKWRAENSLCMKPFSLARDVLASKVSSSDWFTQG